MNRAISWMRTISTWWVGLLCAVAFGHAAAAVNGAIYTTTLDGTTVNGNIYDAKSDVYLTGGPQNMHDPGLRPSGCSTLTASCTNPAAYVSYYFQVTDPSGAVLLSNDPIDCRRVLVQDGRIVGVDPASTCTPPHANGDLNSSNGNTPVQLCYTDSCTYTGPQEDAFADTPNPGGEYKAWLTPVDSYDPINCDRENTGATTPQGGDHGFCDSASKTDNFKVRIAQAAYIVACKFDDANGNGYLESGEALLSGWNLTANGVAAGGSNSTTETLMTDETGCVSFTVLDLNGPITLTEQNQTGWIQTAPNASGVYDGYTGDNTGTATVTAPLQAGQTVTVYFGNNNLASEGLLTFNKTANPTVKYTWGISKSVDKTEIDTGAASAIFNYTVSVTHDGGTLSTVSGDINLSNSLVVDVPGVVVTDTIDNGGTCSISPDSNGVSNGDGTVTETVPAESSIKLHYSCTFTSPSSLSGTNTVTVSQEGIQIGSPQTATYALSGATIVDGSVTVSDPLGGGTLGTVSSTDPSPTIFQYSYTVTGTPGTCVTQDNTATFTTSTTKTTGSAGQTVKLCVGADLKVSKTASPAFTRTYNWNIAKNVDKTLVEQIGGTATFNYEVDVTSGTPAYTDGGWQVTGTITVSNPNDWETVTLTGVSDSIDNNGSCSITSGNTTATLAKKGDPSANDKTQLGYKCTFAGNPVSGTNTATANWSSAAANTPDASASGTATYTFGAPTTEVNKTITVTDTFNNVTTQLGTVTYPNTGTFKYSHTVNVPTTSCLKYTNTAKIVETGQTASQTVEVCGPAPAGGLTMGFWKNPNGQGIIKTGASTGGVCNSGAWLRQYAPFQDLGATATCSQVATYVSSVIGTATCSSSGNTCNAMLKAQMLATALDVYFSDASLGGDKITAFDGGITVAIGGVSIDLTKICPASDGGFSSTGSCENVSAAFGGATSMTVSQMLAYAASKSNVGGSVWYGQVKATQVLAKDAFDAINNQRAFSP